MYPEAIFSETPADYLSQYVNDLLFKDIFMLTGIRNSQGFRNLVYFLATNIGQEISLDSLAREVSLNQRTVSDYIDLLEQSFVIKVCPSYSARLDNELKKGKKIYFVDTGVRNALLDDFSPLSSRPDAGALWENFFYMEKLKFNTYSGNHKHLYFWRTRQVGNQTSKEVDFVEVKNRLPVHGYECKRSLGSHSKGQKAFLNVYPESDFDVVTPNNMLDVLWELKEPKNPDYE